jgi:uncharacterized protein YndB with AHSA1/START domain
MSNENTPEVHLTKDFPVGKQTLYKAWTEPEQLKRWWKPMNKQLSNVENDIRKGGRVAYHFEGGLTIEGEYKEVAAVEKLVYSWNWELPEDTVHKGEYLLTVQFSGGDNKSTLDVTQQNFKPHQEGWEEAMSSLYDFLSKEAVKEQ